MTVPKIELGQRVTPVRRDAWWEDAACKGMTDLFFPSKGDVLRGVDAEIRAVCAGCAVYAQCYQDALERPTYGRQEACGWQAGMSPDEIAKARGMRGRPLKAVAHGTLAGYRRHRTLGEKPCEACRAVGSEERRKQKMRSA